MNATGHAEQLDAADEKGWNGVWAFGGYAASGMLATSLNPLSIVKSTGIRQLVGMVLTNNISDNFKGGEWNLKSFHVGPVGYNVEKNDLYTIFSPGLSDEQRIDMGFETLIGLTFVNSDIKINYHGRHEVISCPGMYARSPVSRITIATRNVGYYSRKTYDMIDAGFKVVKQQSLEQWLYSRKYNNDGTAKY
jgi:hypothetical protein